MGAYKNHEFLAILERKQERDRMDLARREQEYINSRKAHIQQPGKPKTQTPPKGK